MPRKAKCSKPNGDMRSVEFHLDATPGMSVCLAGSFNNWDPQADPMSEEPEGGVYKLAMRLPPGKHEYRFVIGDQWCTDPQNPDTVINTYGLTNSVMTVQ